MKELFLNSFKWILLVGGVLLAGLIVFGVVLAIGWPWWVALFLLLLVAAAGVGIFLLRSLLLRRREQNFVQEVIAQDATVLQRMTGRDRENLSRLQEQWKEGIAILKGSHLKKQGQSPLCSPLVPDHG